METTLEKKIDHFIEKCREHNLKVTPQRLLIFKELVSTKAHPNTDMIYSQVKETFPNISFDTVYRTLLTFSQIGIADIILGTGEPRRFDGNTRKHYHFRCLSCQKVYDIEDDLHEVPIPETVKERFVLKDVKVLFEGTCSDCSSSGTKN